MKRILFFSVLVLFLLTCGQLLAATIQGNVTYSGSETGTVYILYAATSGSTCDLAEWNAATQQALVGTPPVSYNITVPDGTYCIAAFLDAAPTGFPPSFNDPVGFYGGSTPATVTVPPNASNIDVNLSDPGPLTGLWDVTANVNIGSPLNTSCVYSGTAAIWDVSNQSGLLGMMTLASSTPMCLAYSPIGVGIVCDTSSYPTLNCRLDGVPGSPYDIVATISPDGISANGTFGGKFEGTDFNVEWSARKQTTNAVPSMTEWGIMLFIILTGISSVYYLRRMRKA